MSLKFQKKIEDFVCEHCGAAVKGNGFTNHCPHCLWSKHVDINPGDRLSPCGGMMMPFKLESDRGRFMLSNKCVLCHYIKRNRLEPEDDFDAALKAVRENEKASLSK